MDSFSYAAMMILLLIIIFRTGRIIDLLEKIHKNTKERTDERSE